MKAALLLVDLQQDFLARPGLLPEAPALVAAVARLLELCRARGVPVLHSRTHVRADGRDAMPHRVRSGRLDCVEGTPGAEPPRSLAPARGESLVTKRYFSAFEDPALEARLRELEVDTLVVAGLYLHACVRATVLDAYARGFQVVVAQEAVASTEPLHASLTQHYLDGRAARFLATAALADLFAGKGITLAADAAVAQVARAVERARTAQPRWQAVPLAERLAVLDRWCELLVADTEVLARLLATEIGKPVSAAREELARAVAHVSSARRVAAARERLGADTEVMHRPVGCVALVTPWNNPVAIPVGKLAPALAFGNAVVWKPSPRAPQCTRRLRDTLIASGVPADLVVVLEGDAEVAQALARAPDIAAVSVTGSQATGRALAAVCAAAQKPLQSELGGNNAVIVLEDADLGAVAAPLARAAFGFAGQRCTALRRFIVMADIASAFERAIVAAAEALRIGDPLEATTEIGPLVTNEHCTRVSAAVAQARREGARLLTGGHELECAGWRGYAPTLLADLAPTAAIVQQELFGPVAVIQVARDLDEAIALANAVPQGLLAVLVGGDATARAKFAANVVAGMLQFGPGPLAIDPDAPFIGWKASGSGVAEHGRWDREFYARPQTHYGVRP
jgi:acyl-CoA reductase-like NAD-dependent aldehyde dehydrogenase